MDKRITSLTSEAAGLQKEVSKLESELTTISNELTLEEAKSQLAAVKSEIAKGMFCVVNLPVDCLLRKTDTVNSRSNGF